MPAAATMDFPTASALLRLRLLAEDARRRAHDQSDAGRHIALVSMDGACEYALWLAVRTHSVSVKKDPPSFHEQFRALKQELRNPPWKPQGWPGVEQMHRARNDAQHAAVVPDPVQLPVWSDAAWAFIDSLCRAAFGVALGDIVLAQAVRDPELGTCLRWSEEALSVEPGRAFQLALEAFDRAREHWRAQQASLGFSPQQPRSLYFSPQYQEGGPDVLQDLDSLLEVQPFTTDIGEYFWLRRARREFEFGRWPPQQDDERRALLFVVGWIIRWEIFVDGYPEDRWDAHRESITPPTQDGGPAAIIVGGESELLGEVAGGGPRRIRFHLQLANVPSRGRPPWPESLTRGLTDAAKEAGHPGLFNHIVWDLDGLLELQIALGSNPSTIIAAVRDGLSRALAQHESHLVHSQLSEQGRKETEDAFGQLFDSARSDLAFFGTVTVRPDEWMNTGGCIVFVHLQEGAAGSEEVTHALNIFRSAAKCLSNVHFRDGCVAFEAREITEDVEAAIRDAVERSEQQVHHLRGVRGAQAESYNDFARRVRDEFGPLAGEG